MKRVIKGRLLSDNPYVIRSDNGRGLMVGIPKLSHLIPRDKKNGIKGDCVYIEELVDGSILLVPEKLYKDNL